MKYWSHLTVYECPHCGGHLFIEVPSVNPAKSQGNSLSEQVMLPPNEELEAEARRGIAQFEEMLRGYDAD